MLWMGIWVHPYAVILHVQVGVNLRKTGVWPSLYDVVVSWLRLPTPINCIPHASLCCNKCVGGGEFYENWVWPSLYDVVVSWLRLQTLINCIPHPCWMYTKCFSTLRCCGWAYGYTLPYSRYTSAGGGEFKRKWGMTKPFWCCGVMADAANPH